MCMYKYYMFARLAMWTILVSVAVIGLVWMAVVGFVCVGVVGLVCVVVGLVWVASHACSTSQLTCFSPRTLVILVCI